MRIARSSSLSLFVLAIACHQPIESDAERVVGTIDGGGPLQRVIEGPAVVSRGQSFTVTVATFGNGCVTAAGADVVIDGLISTITPYDVVVRATCPDILKTFPRAVQLSFGQAGAATVRVNGRSFYQPGLIAVEHALVVSQ